jgi:DNA gyrase subunit A
MTVDNFRSQNRGGKGIKGMQTLEEDFIEDLFMTTTHHYLMFFTNFGRSYRIKAYEIPEAGRTARGTAIINLLQLQPGEKITAVIPIKDWNNKNYLTMATRKGIIKKTPMADYANIRKTGLQAINLREDDELIEVKMTDGDRKVILVTRNGMSICFHESDVRNTGRVSMGVIGMDLDDDDEVVAMQVDDQGECLLIVSENGMGKRTLFEEFHVQRRGGKGLKCYKITERTGSVVGAKAVNEEDEIMMITNEGIVMRTGCSSISVLKRITSGVKLMDVKYEEGIKVANIAKVSEEVRTDQDTEEESGEETTEE